MTRLLLASLIVSLGALAHSGNAEPLDALDPFSDCDAEVHSYYADALNQELNDGNWSETTADDQQAEIESQYNCLL